ncbi:MULTISPECIES: LPXTG cell wall anchor domain-containing protein [Lachnospiraceae]|uniref:LPXTG cell wall anchor domain-containing protein n=1 Tax=Lachnospiraceae TaxID=186803 RepID=UPI0022E156E4|nr:LPXTG cell wall anchor domain-containing protein [Dorea amylophila]
MKSKYRFRRILSGVMAAVTILSTVISPLTVYASEEPKTAEPPAYESVKDLLDEEEVVKANDLELEVGQEFDVSSDRTNLEIKDESKVKVTFQKAESDAGESFSTGHADTYHAVYYVEPVNQNHPVYQIGRNLIVKEPVAASQSEPQTEQAVTEEDTGSDDEEAASQEETETEPVETEIVEPETAESETEEAETEEPEETESEFQDGLSESEFDAALEESETENTTDAESGLTLSDVLEQAGEQDIDLIAMEDGETVSFTAVNTSTRATQDVNVTRGTAYYYADYGLGSYVTYKYTVKFGNVSATAYCVQPSKAGPGDGVYKITKLGDSKALAKVCYYGTKASGENGFFSEKHPDFSAGKQFIIVHLAASYANNSGDAFSGTNATGQALAMELYNYCMSQPEIPEVDMSFSNADVTAYISGNSQRTEEITFKASELQTITMKLPSGVRLHNVTTGKTSSVGASVEICGGTKFYLSAPLTQAVDVKGEWSSTMKGSIIKDYSAYKITTGSETQDLALVFGEGVTDEKYVDFKVSWVKQATLEIVKKDRKSNKAIAGAVYGVYSDKDGKNMITKMPATDDNGASSVTITKTQDTVYLKEISVPNGYLLDTKAYDVNLVIGGTVKQTVTDAEQMASLTVYKLGEVLTGAKVTDDGVSFVYTEQKQKGAVYNVYAASDIVSADGTVVYKKDALVKAGLTTGDDGSATLDNLYLGKYVVKEMQAPQNLVCTGESQEITLSYAGSNVEKVMGSVTFKNDRQKASVSVYKQDKETRKYLPGGTYGLYAGNDIKAADGTIVVKKDTLIEKAVTGIDGKAVYQADLPIANSYYMKELGAPAGYVRNGEDVYSFTFQYTTDKEATVSFNHTFQNERINAKIKLVKEDSETGKTAQGDATLEGAVYGLYAREDIVHPDGQTGVLYPAGTQIATLTTDTEGNAEVADLYLGKYYVKELTPPVGYLADPGEHDLECNDEGDLVQTVERTVTSLEDVIKQPFQVIKAANNGKTDADLLKGVGFSAYLESSLKKNKDGSYDFTSATPVVLTADGQTEMFTDERGYACSIPLAYGTYIVRETTTPHNFKPVDDFKVVISENNPEKPQVWRVLLDEEFEAKLKIVKKDDETKKSVLVPNTEFKVYDLDNKKYVEQVTTYPSTTVHKSYFTDENGYLILPQNLACGNYRIEEVTAPDGYTHSTNTVEIKVDSDTAYQEDPVSGDLIIEVDFENHPAKGRLTIRKEGEVVKGFDKDFTYEEASLAGAVFEVYASEDIYTADHQTDENGNRYLEYAKDTLVATVTTDETGSAVIENLPLGKYRVEEKKAPEGYTWNAKGEKVTFTYAGQDTPVVDEEVTFTNERQKVSITVEKQDAETGSVVAGAVFGLYNKNEIKSGDNVIVKADTLLQEITSDEKGQAHFTLDLPLGTYYVKEISAPDGFVSSDEVLEFDATYQGQDIQTIKLKSIKKNQPTTIEVTKSDLTTGVELNGASLSVLDEDGNVIDSWTSVKDEPHVIKYLTVGKTYILRESLAPLGYLKTTDVKFTIEDTAEIQKVEMQDHVPKALLIVNKKGEFLDKITLLDNVKGVVEHFFEYITGSLTDVTFEIRAAEDIKAADGVSPDYYSKDELVATVTTDANGVAEVSDLPVGKYYVKEVGTAYGYILDEEPRYVDLSYRDQDTPVVVYDEDWQNNRQKVKVNVLKKEKDTDRVLKGGIFGLYTRNDILSASGKVLMEADTLIELKTTDVDGKISFIADLPIDGTYYVKELYAPDGFVTTGEEQEFVFEYQGDKEAEVSYEFVFEDEPTTVELSKTDLTTGEELPGARLQLTDENGAVVEEWTSTKEPHIIKELVVGKSYTLTETKPADGYATAESITFTVENTVEIQKQVMEDDVTKVEISKTDITGDNEIEGAKLTITDENGNIVETWTSGKEPHYIEKLPIGKYTLKEEQAPNGYVVSEEITFEVADTAEIQKVAMKDDTAKGRLIIEKTDKDTGAALKGAEFELRDADGKVVETLTTDENGHATSGLLAIGTYKDGKFDKAAIYYLVETKAPEGYQMDETKHEVTFTYVDDKTPVIEVIQKVTNEKLPEDTPSVSNPKTGDDTNLWFPALCLILSTGGLIGMGVASRRKKKKGGR